MVRNSKTICCVMVVAVAVVLCTGCSSKFTCSSNNVMGFEGYYYEDGELYVVFDEDRLDDNMERSVYEDEEWRAWDDIYVHLGDDVYEVDSDDVDVDVSHGQLLISFEMDRADAGKITGFYFHILHGRYILDLEEGTLDVELEGGDCKEYFFQTYDQSKDKWSEADYELETYDWGDDVCEEKPVIYLYPTEETDVTVTLDLDGELTCTYPEYGDGWNVTASPDGKIYDPNTDRYYDYLFWEGTRSFDSYEFTNYACVPGEDTAEFLESYLEAAGLNDSEIDDFISYWLPRLQESPYNLISFPSEEYNEWAKLNVYPEPDTVIRVYMVFAPVDEPVEVPESNALIMPSGIEREGFTVVEWGGSVLYDVTIAAN